MRHLSEFPYDPTLDIATLYGLEKLRAMEDREMAQRCLDVHNAMNGPDQSLPQRGPDRKTLAGGS